MIAELFLKFAVFILSLLPTIPMFSGASHAIDWLISVAGYINIFIPLAGIVPIIGMIILVRNWYIVHAVIRFILRFIPFIDGG